MHGEDQMRYHEVVEARKVSKVSYALSCGSVLFYSVAVIAQCFSHAQSLAHHVRFISTGEVLATHHHPLIELFNVMVQYDY